MHNHLKTRKRKRIITMIAVVIIAALIVIISLREIQIRQLRADMEGFLADAVAHIDSGKFNIALADAEDAKALAMRLRDSDFAGEINAHIWLIEEVIRGDELFDAGRYRAARNAYLLALDYASDVRDLGSGYIDDMVATTDAYIHFYSLIERAEGLAILAGFDEALALYEEARSAASELLFADGLDIVAAGIKDVNERIALLKRAEALGFLAQGDECLQSGRYEESIVYYERALEIYRDLNDSQYIAIVIARIELSRRILEEQARKEAQEAEDASKGGTQEDTQDNTQDNSQDNSQGNTQEDTQDNAQDNSQGNTQEDTDEDTQGNTDEEAGTEQNEPKSNYDHNLSIYFDMSTLIDDQSQSPANQIRMGSVDNLNEGWYNGCGWVSTYNALILLGNPRHPADIVNYFETGGGTVLEGVFGTYPRAIEGLLKALGYNVSYTLFPQISLNIDDAIRAAKVGILAYAHTSAAHYVAIEYREEDGKFIVYNDSLAKARSIYLGYQNDSETGAVIDSVEALIQYSPNILFSFALITVSP